MGNSGSLHNGVRLGPTVQVAPGNGIPADARLRRANNNLDVIRSDGSRFLAIRSSLVHFATPLTHLVVLRSDDEGGSWVTERLVDHRRDLREPRFCEVGGRLFLYFFEAGTNPFAFEPGRIMATERIGPGAWTHPVAVSGEDFVVWRTKVVDGTPYMVRYHGGGDAYARGDASISVELLTTTDGYDWVPVDPQRPVVHTGGAGETDFAFDGEGRLWAVMRNEAGERGRFGSLVCTAEPGNPAEWTCTDDPRKFDSPLVFAHRGEIWMLARRQVARDGHYEVAPDRLPRDAQLLVNQATYWVTPKRLSLWRVDRSRRAIDWVLDLPSRGDTAFPGIIWNGPDTLDVYNYSSPPGNDAMCWLRGQLGRTSIYATSLHLPS